MEQPKDFSSKENPQMVFKLKNVIFGLKQARMDMES